MGIVIPVNSKFRNNLQSIEVYLCSNGVHTDFVLPAKNHLHNWKELLDDTVYETPFSEQSYLGIGWGDRGFYLDTPTWAELKPKTAIVAMCIPSPTVMHVTSYPTPPLEMKYFERIFLTEAQYQQLCQYILKYFALKNEQVDLIPDVGYTSNDNFYKANGSYHAFNTCNYWINRGLNRIGVRTALWSPIDKGIFFQLKKIKPSI